MHSFREDDQEALYHRVQSGATQAHAGLGRAAMPKKVAGARWEGTKTRLGSDSESEGGAESEEEMEEEEEGEEQGNGIVIVMPRTAAAKARGVSGADAPGSEAPPAAAPSAPGKPPVPPTAKPIKWKKLVLQTLQQSEKKKLRHSKLVAAVARAAGLPKEDRLTVHAAVEGVIKGSKRLQLKEDRVHLVV